MSLVIIFNYKSLSRLHKVTIGIIILFIISQINIDSSSYDFMYHISRGNIYFFNRYLYILIFILFLNSIKIPSISFQKGYNYLEVLLFINCLVIIFGILFEINIFKSYESTPRFGYAGLFSKPEEAGFIYCIAIIYNYYYWSLNKSKTNLIKVAVFIATILVLGQKKMFLFVALLICMHLLFQVKYKKFFRVIIPVLGLIVIIFNKKIFSYLISHSSFWTRIYQEKGLLSTLTSTRSDLVKNVIIYIKANWDTYNFIFGGIDFNKYKVEFEAFDLYIFLGIFGLLFYYYFIKTFFYKNLDNLKRRLVFTLFLTSFLGGGLLLSVTATLLLYIVINKVMVVNDNE
ncbi:hypothetical protein [uncultured Lacinutrix sp.]|uniref:hypothetical protein n=1 Tax=uncultured Lacinutrix sp. TaxID=574032 RepID=UPI00262AF6A9|nr:hypothetical protein [uncultured Lacinutrix sp.]